MDAHPQLSKKIIQINLINYFLWNYFLYKDQVIISKNQNKWKKKIQKNHIIQNYNLFLDSYKIVAKLFSNKKIIIIIILKVLLK